MAIYFSIKITLFMYNVTMYGIDVKYIIYLSIVNNKKKSVHVTNWFVD